LDGLVNLGKAAEVLGVTREELIKEFKKRGIPVRVPDRADVLSDLRR
ncbi:UPF0175 family protein, partial [Thermococcus sp.]